MAVPFSKPLYPGGPPRRVGPPRRGQTQNQQQNINTRRPSNGNHQAAPRHHTQAPEPRPQQQQQTSQHQRYQHPIERFLYGDGVIQLDRLSRVTRIAFYALFEAWRLLQDSAQHLWPTLPGICPHASCNRMPLPHLVQHNVRRGPI